MRSREGAAHLGLKGRGVAGAGVGNGLGDKVLVVLRVVAVVAHACFPAVVPCAMPYPISELDML